mmetsp:Transcript_8375/g.25175  ORF Transcript_8375/g.25175 Transcript_8375/m.25175 type:complete len:191 (+) Transcript_8375:364-936(+)
MGDADEDSVELSGWFREDSRLIYADVLVFVKLVKSMLSVHGNEAEPPSVTVNIVGAQVLTKERNHKIMIETSETKIRLYAISRREFLHWSTVLRRVAAGDLKRYDDQVEFEKPQLPKAEGPMENTNIVLRRNASIEYAPRSASLDDGDYGNRAASLDIRPQHDSKGDANIMRRLTRTFRKGSGTKEHPNA